MVSAISRERLSITDGSSRQLESYGSQNIERSLAVPPINGRRPQSAFAHSKSCFSSIRNGWAS